MMARVLSVTGLLLLFCLGGTSVGAQTNPTVRVVRRAVIVNSPRSDGAVVGRVDEGVVLEVIGRSGSWLEVVAPTGTTGWQQGWVHGTYVVGASGALSFGARSSRSGPPKRRLIRGFAEGGGTIFAATSSFEAILGEAHGLTYGGGVQVTLANGLLLQGSADWFKKTGRRALVSGTQVYRLPTPDQVTMIPVEGTVGYRQAVSSRVAGYVGAGAGRLLLKEESPGFPTTKSGHFQIHFALGGEFMIVPGIWTAGEIQFRGVPKGLSSEGIGRTYKETNLGGTTFLFKILLGH
jgi:hypothetical protein